MCPFVSHACCPLASSPLVEPRSATAGGVGIQSKTSIAHSGGQISPDPSPSPLTPFIRPADDPKNTSRRTPTPDIFVSTILEIAGATAGR